MFAIYITHESENVSSLSKQIHLAVLSHHSPTPSAFAEHLLSRSEQFYIQKVYVFTLIKPTV